MIRLTVDIPDGADMAGVMRAAVDAGAVGFTATVLAEEVAAEPHADDADDADDADGPMQAPQGKVNPGSVRAALEAMGPSSANKIAQHCGMRTTNGTIGKLLRKMADDGDIKIAGKLWALDSGSDQ